MQAGVKYDILPHFTVKVMLELEGRLYRMIEQRMVEDFANDRIYSRYWHGGIINFPGLAHELVLRIFRTQIREAKAAVSFADAMIEWDKKNNPNSKLKDAGAGKLDALMAEQAGRIGGAQKLQEEY